MKAKIDENHPIRKKMIWVGLIQWIAAGAILAGVGAEAVNEWSTWLIGGLSLLVMGGVLVKGTTEAEKNTTPLDDEGDPLNPEYGRLVA